MYIATIILNYAEVDINYHMFDGEIRIDSIHNNTTGKKLSVEDLSSALYKEAVDKIAVANKNNVTNEL